MVKIERKNFLDKAKVEITKKDMISF